MELKRVIREENYSDLINRIYEIHDTAAIRTVTFQVTDDCCCACTYCYQGHKGHRMMSKEVAKKGVDLLFKLYEDDDGDFINHNTRGIIIDFIGGEPLMNIEVIDYVCTYFMQRCIEEHHPWANAWRASMISNGTLYFDPRVQEFLHKFRGFVSFGVTIDGPKEIHNACRVYHDGRGNFDDAYAAMKHFNSNYYEELSTKVTIAPENLKDINKIVNFFLDEGMNIINANTVYEAEWTIEDARIFYVELKKMADNILQYNGDIYVSLFENFIGEPMQKNDNGNWCGGTGAMLAFDPDGIAYPCIRYMPSAIGDDQKPLVIGSVDGLWKTTEQNNLQKCLNCITRRSQSTDECFNCPVAKGCSWCSAWNYQCFGTPDKRCTNICIMHKARVLANAYYWNKLYIQNNATNRYELHLPEDDALKIIDKSEYDMLIKLSKRK